MRNGEKAILGSGRHERDFTARYFERRDCPDFSPVQTAEKYRRRRRRSRSELKVRELEGCDAVRSDAITEHQLHKTALRGLRECGNSERSPSRC